MKRLLFLFFTILISGSYAASDNKTSKERIVYGPLEESKAVEQMSKQRTKMVERVYKKDLKSWIFRQMKGD